MSDIAASSFVRQQLVSERPAPIKTTGFIGFLRTRLFNSPTNILLTIVSIIVLWLTVIPAVKFLLVDGVRAGYRPHNSTRRNRSFFRLLYFGQQHDKFIAALTADRIRATDAVHQAFSDRLKQLVADRMSQRIVDVFEAVQIQKQHRDRLLVTVRRGDRLANPVVQQQAIG